MQSTKVVVWCEPNNFFHFPWDRPALEKWPENQILTNKTYVYKQIKLWYRSSNIRFSSLRPMIGASNGLFCRPFTSRLNDAFVTVDNGLAPSTMKSAINSPTGSGSDGLDILVAVTGNWDCDGSSLISRFLALGCFSRLRYSSNCASCPFS